MMLGILHHLEKMRSAEEHYSQQQKHFGCDDEHLLT